MENQFKTIKNPEMIDALKKEVKHFMQNFKDDSRFLSSWGHAYFCYEDGAPLVFDIENPYTHKCSICSKEYKGFIFDGCHITMLRNLAAVTAIKSAVLFHITDDKSYIEIIKQIIGFYAKNYEGFAKHAKEKITDNSISDVGGAGKIMPQGLNEAILSIRFITALDLLGNNIDNEFLEECKTLLFKPIYDLLLPQKMHIHNIPCWINSAIGVMGLFFSEKEWINEAFENPFNINEQVEKGVTEAGFWYEGSIHYNFFALEGIMSLLVFCKKNKFDISQKTLNSVKKMLFAAYDYAFKNQRFPNPSDGWPKVNLKTYSYVYHMAVAVFGDEILDLLAGIEQNKEERTRLPLSEPYYFENKIPLEHLIYSLNADFSKANLPKERKSKSLESYNSAILRNKYFDVFFKYGHQTKSHAHPDKMSVEVMVSNLPLTSDLSNSGYASKLCNQWHRKNIAHSTCMIDGLESDIENGGTLLDYSENKVSALSKPYDNVVYKRTLALEDDVMFDSFSVNCETERNIEWFYHFDQKLNLNTLSLEKTNDLSEYNYLLDCKKIVVSKNLSFGAENVDICIDLEDNATAYIAKTYSNPANTLRDTLIIRKQAKSALFEMKVLVKNGCK